MSPRDWLLLLVSVGEEDAPDYIDPIRLQKGMFLLSERGPERHIYEFRPFHWGPFSPAIYEDLTGLEQAGLIESDHIPGRTWHVYRPTPSGKRAAMELQSSQSEGSVGWVRRVRRYVSSRSFVQLLREIYAAYPEYSTKTKLA